MLIYTLIAAAVLFFVLFTLAALQRRRHFAVIARADEEDLQLNVVSLAQSMTVRDKAGVSIPVFSVLRKIKKAYRLVRRKALKEERLFECEKWLYENGNAVLTRFSPAQTARLNALPRSRGKVRAVALANLLTSLDRCGVDAEKCADGIRLFNKYAPLTDRELFALPAAFSYALLRHISRICGRICEIDRAVRYAEADKKFDPAHAKLPGYTYFCKQRDLPGAQNAETDAAHAEITFGIYLSDSALLISRAISALKALPEIFTQRFLLSVSPLEALFSRDETYRMTDDDSRRLYTAAAGKAAERYGVAERVVAEKCLQYAEKTGEHFGKALFDGVLLRAVIKEKEALERTTGRAAALFAGAAFFLCAAFAVTAAVFMPSPALSAAAFFAVLFTSVAPAEYLVMRACAAFLPARCVPRLNLEKIPERGSVLAVISVVLADEQDARNALRDLKALRACNRGENVGFVLLADFKTADKESLAQDSEVIKELKKAEGEKDIFVLLRRRSLCHGKWYGRERKRGAIEDMNALLLRGEREPFVYIGNMPFSPVYVLLLDADSRLNVGGVRRAVAAAMHPLAAEYDILTFGSAYSLSSLKTLFSRRYLCESGREEYAANGDFYYDLCGESIFCGKGIYNLRSFDAKLRGALPQGRVLSHDIAEGALTLCGSAGERVFEDAPPTYYAAAKRKERWQRGDLLLLPLAFSARRVGALYRYIILRNVLEIFRPCVLFAALIAALCLQNLPFGIAVAACFLFKPLLAAGFALYSAAEGVRMRYALIEFFRVIANLIRDVLMLPFAAAGAVCVTLKTLFKLICKGDLLEWTTFAGSAKEPLSQHFAVIMPGMLLCAAVSALAFMALAPAVYAAACAAYACLLIFGGKEIKEKRLTKKELVFLRACAADTYAYFVDMSEKSAYITDNYALYPEERPADMTSPTDMGMALLAHVCACECGLTDSRSAAERIQKQLKAIARLKKWKGNLFNWYGTDGSVKSPAFVSSVDNGNFIACLICVRAFLRKFGEDAGLADALIENARLTAFFDKNTGRAHIGFDKDKGAFVGSYDMFASEARITAYIAAAREGNAAYWESMRRDLIPNKGNMLVSWAGTAFEYLMPQLFLLHTRDGLTDRSCKYACRIMSAEKRGGIFGMSESGYYAFDESGNYMYSQFGSSALSLKAQSARRVISPYSSALMLEYTPHRAVRNLKKLKQMGVYGKYGFYEAFDLTANRTVHSFMSHHQGMIMAAVANAIDSGCIRRAFAEDDAMRGGAVMTGEKTPRRRVGRKPRADASFGGEGSEKFSACMSCLQAFPKVALLSAGDYSVAVNERGNGSSRLGKVMINRREYDVNRHKDGIFIVKDEDKTYSSVLTSNGERSACVFSYTADKISYQNKKDGCATDIFLLAGAQGEVRKLTVKNTGDKVRKLKISYYERLALTEEEEYLSHPAYADMFVGAKYEGGAVFYEKRNKAEEGGVYGLVKVCGAQNVRYTCCAANVLRRISCTPDEGDVLSPCIAFDCELTLAPQEERCVYLMKAFSFDKEELPRFAQTLDEDNYFSHCEMCAELSSLRTQRYRSSAGVNKLLSVFAPQLFYPQLSAQKTHNFVQLFGKRCFVLHYERDFTLLEEAILSVLYLNLCGLSCRLYIVTSAADEYFEQKKQRLLHGTRAGNVEKTGLVHIVDIGEYRRIFGAEPAYSATNAPQDIVLSESVPVYKKAVCEHIEKPEKELKSGFGYFDGAGDYIVTSPPALPYSNVVADMRGGFVVTENGGGFTFAQNSCENKITFWHNDPAEDAPSERLYLFVGGRYLRLNKLQPGGFVRHRLGMTEFVGCAEGVYYRLELKTVCGGAGKIYDLYLWSREGETAAEISFQADLMLGRICDPFAVRYSTFEGGIKGENIITGQCAYLNCLQGAQVYTKKSYADIFIKPRPGRAGAALPCAWLTKRCEVSAGTEERVSFLLTSDLNVLLGVTPENLDEEAEKQLDLFKKINKTHISGISEEERLLMERLPYQIYSSRLAGRCGYYQAGGAIGFRDRLQDCLAYLYADAGFAARAICDCAAHQYEEGDVMHWWHPPFLGVRTRITDDRLFLAYVTAEYIRHTGDKDILNKRIKYLHSAPLAKGEEARMETGVPGEIEESLLKHILRAINSAYVRGEHGLLLIGGGDWNDALNGVGLQGRGESVWLSEFCCATIKNFLPYIPVEEKSAYIDMSRELAQAVERAYFEGRYARAFTDEGVWLGRGDSPCCKTDIISQAWAVIAGIADKSRAESALKAAKMLIDKEKGVVRLLAPAFDRKFYCGYISAYPQGVRENGGQYTHAAVWLLKAFCMVKDAKSAAELVRMLDPIYACKGEGAKTYGGEPYAIAADVYYNKDMKGRMGWSWYTGSAAWYYKTYLEDYLGFRIVGGAIECTRPLIKDFCNVIIKYEHKGAKFTVKYAEGERDCVRENGVNMTGVRIGIDRQPGEYEVTFVFARGDDKEQKPESAEIFLNTDADS